jgi:hypothetical protein
LAHEMAHHISHPSIIQKGRTNDGQMVTVDDYREAYWWLRDNTDEDARVVRIESESVTGGDKKPSRDGFLLTRLF